MPNGPRLQTCHDGLIDTEVVTLLPVRGPEKIKIQAKEFTDFLKQSNPISIQVQQVFRPRNGVFNSEIVHKTPELVVDIFDSHGVNIVEKLRSYAHLGKIIRDQFVNGSSCAESSVPSEVAASPSSRCLPPKPEHLADDQRVEFDLEEAGVSEAGFTKSLERVEGWLNGLSGQEIHPIDYPQVFVIVVSLQMNQCPHFRQKT